MFRPVSTTLDLVKLEHEILDFWKGTRAFEVLRERNKDGKPWSFLDGPITANNPMGVHHAWGRTLKDCFQRFHAMQGRALRYQNGFDCQGLWVEVEVERALGFKSKREIESYGLERFIEQCKERVRKYSRIQTEQSIRLGYWMDWDDSYFTMSDGNNYAIWSFLKKCHARGLIRRGKDAMPWCTRCGTGISEQERREGYRRIEDTAVYASFPLKDAPGESLLVWTTTPWTLPANVACAVHPDLEYARVEQKGRVLILAKDRLAVLQELGPYKILATFPGRDLVGRAYAGAFDDWATPRDARHAHRVIPWKEVLATEGTGIVHIAPGCGKEDFDLGRENALPVLAPIDEAGLYVAGYGPLTGKLASGVAEEVLSHLRERGHYYKKERYSHDYPHCWRCGTNLLFRTVDEWFISMSWRDEIAAVARQIRWIPGHGLDQELDWLSNMGDWMISKKRYWGLALPIWTCTEGHFDVIGSGEELRARATAGWDAFEGHSPHRPWVDAVRIACSTCGKDASRIPDVGNPWLDAGIVPYSTVRYETDREYWKRWIPADAVVECFPGQFRNWFYALLAMSTMMENLPPFRTLLGHALVRDEKGAEMHKSTGNAIGFDEAAEKAGVDTLRWIYCRQNPVTNLNFGYGVADAVKRRFFNTWWNVYAFFANYARSDRFDPRQPAVPVAERQDIDRWILSRLHGVARLARERLGDFDTPLLARAAEEFVDALSTWYVRRCRRRFWRARSESDRDKLAAYQTLHEVLVTLAKLLAPLVPFTAEAMYQNLVRSWDADAPASVHHCAYPEPDAAGSDKALAREMDAALRLVSATLSLRESLSLRVRQPLRELTIATTDPVLQQAARRFEPHLLDELNLKSLRVQAQTGREVRCDVKPNFKTLGERYGKDRGLYIQALKGALAADPDRVSGEIERGVARIPLLDGTPWHVQRDEVLLQKGAAPGMENLAMAEHPGFTLLLDTTVTPEMAREGVARDLVRHIQQARGDLDLEFTSRIRVTIESDAAPLAQAIAAHRPFILEETFADELREEPTPDGREIDLGGMNIRLKVEPIGAPPSISR